MLKMKVGKYNSNDHTFMFVFDQDPSVLFNCKFFVVDVIESNSMYRLRPMTNTDSTRNSISYNKKSASFMWYMHFAGDQKMQEELSKVQNFTRTEVEYEIDANGINFVIPSEAERVQPRFSKGRGKSPEIVTTKMPIVKPNMREYSSIVGNSRQNIRTTIDILNDQIRALNDLGISIKIRFENGTVKAKVDGEL